MSSKCGSPVGGTGPYFVFGPFESDVPGGRTWSPRMCGHGIALRRIGVVSQRMRHGTPASMVKGCTTLPCRNSTLAQCCAFLPRTAGPLVRSAGRACLRGIEANEQNPACRNNATPFPGHAAQRGSPGLSACCPSRPVHNCLPHRPTAASHPGSFARCSLCGAPIAF